MLKRSALVVTFGIITTLSLSSHANEYQQMMDGMLQFQHCITETMAANYMETMAASSEKMSDEITRLCSAGKRDQAQNLALDYSKEMLDDPNFIAMQKCVAQLGSFIPDAVDQDDIFNLDELENSHVCDQLDN